MEPRFKEETRDLQNVFGIQRFRYIQVLFRIFYYYWRGKKIARYTEEFVIFGSLYRGSRFHRISITILLREFSQFSAIPVCIGQMEASTCPPPAPPPGIRRAFDTFAVSGRREFDYQSLPGGGEFDPHALGVGNLNCALDFM